MKKPFYSLVICISFGKLSLSLFTMIMTVMMLSLTGSATLASLVVLIQVLGKVASTFVFPIVTMRFPLSKIVSYSLFVQIIILTSIVVITLFIKTNIFVIILSYIILGLVGFVDGFVSPSRLSLIPEIVSDKSIGRANSFINISDQTLSLLGWSIGAVALNYYGNTYMFLVSVSLLIVSYYFSRRIRSNKKTSIKKRPNMEVIREGWFILFSPRDRMRTITIMDILEGIASGIWIGGISLLFVNEVLGKGEEWWGYINTAYYAGSILGGILISIFAFKIGKHLIDGIILGSFIVSILILGYALNQNAYISLVLVVLMGPFYQLRDISQQTYIQKIASLDILPRVYASKDTLSYLVFSFSVFLSGIIADIGDVVNVYYLAFILYFTSACMALLSFNTKEIKTDRER